MPQLIAPPALADIVRTGRTVRLLDVRWRLDAPEGRPAYLTGHLPGAVYVDLERDLSHPGDPDAGRYPPPSVTELEQAARRWGIDDGDLVVAYDDNDAVAAAHAWWLLQGAGLDILVLDGGIRGWISAGLPLESGDRAPDSGTVRLLTARGYAERGLVTIDEAARTPVAGQLIDVRSPDHYRGHSRGLDPAAGHIPGAVNVPTVTHMAQDGTLRAPDEVRATLQIAGVDDRRPIVLYCSVGIASSHSALALATAGISARVFPGSWSQWSRTRGRPVAVGRTPADALQGW